MNRELEQIVAFEVTEWENNTYNKLKENDNFDIQDFLEIYFHHSAGLRHTLNLYTYELEN